MCLPALRLLRVLLYATVLVPALPVLARDPPGRAPVQADATMDCSVLKRHPNPPMSVADCEAMKASQGALIGAVAAPGGERPGDEAMTCEQIIAEMRSSNFAGISVDTAEESKAAGEELQSTVERRNEMAQAMATRQTAATAAASLGPNAVQGAVAAANSAEQQALARDAMRDMQGARARAMAANAASALELAASLQANPRFARLMQLVMAKNCDTNDAPAPR
ncbi:MAG: hypothetical protein J0L88_07855 [Xanthomonadales bacterium]|nr:hypothetical protein [Xanthomonadales bacterium]